MTAQYIEGWRFAFLTAGLDLPNPYDLNDVRSVDWEEGFQAGRLAYEQSLINGLESY
jgi:hypothetical protein